MHKRYEPSVTISKKVFVLQYNSHLKEFIAFCLEKYIQILERHTVKMKVKLHKYWIREIIKISNILTHYGVSK